MTELVLDPITLEAEKSYTVTTPPESITFNPTRALQEIILNPIIDLTTLIPDTEPVESIEPDYEQLIPPPVE